MIHANLEAIAALRQMPVELVTTAELALYLRCDRGTIQRMVYRGLLHPILVGRCWRFDRREAVAALRRG